MKNKVTIKKPQGEYLQHCIFEDQQVQDDFLQMLYDTHVWGKPEHQAEVSPEVRNEQGEIVTEAIYETIPAEYVVEIEDITEQFNQEIINKEAEEYLKSTDWYVIREVDEGVPCPAEIKTSRAEARVRIVR